MIKLTNNMNITITIWNEQYKIIMIKHSKVFEQSTTVEFYSNNDNNNNGIRFWVATKGRGL